MNRISDLLNPYKGLPREIYVIFISRIINAMGCFVMPLLTLILTEKIGLPSNEAGRLISLSGLAFLIPGLIGGKLADTIGRKKVIAIFDALAATFYITCSFMEPSMNMVYVIMLAGACMSTAGPAHDSLIADLTTPENRKSAYALSYMGWNMGFAFGPVLGGMLYKDHLSILFIGNAFSIMIALSLVLIFIKETINKTKEEIKDASRSLEIREEGSIFSVLARRPILIYFALIMFGYNFAYSQWSFMMPMHTSQNFGGVLSGRYFGMMAGFNGLIVILFTPIMTKLTHKIKNIRCMMYGGILYAVGFGMLGVINTLAAFFISVFIFTIGEIVLAINNASFIANHTPASHRGRMSSVLPLVMGMGHILGPMIMGNAILFTGIEKGWLIVGAVVGICSIFTIGLEKYDDRKTAELHVSQTSGEAGTI